MKRYVLFAGVNGAGKTTMYQSALRFKEMKRINLDEIVREFGSWKNPTDVSRAGRIAVQEIKRCFDEGLSFNQETTLCGKSIIRNVHRANNNGYRIEMYYVGISSAELAIQRVQERVKAGGHGVPPEDIIRRFEESLRNLKELIPICDHVEIFDNTQVFRLVLVIDHGIITQTAEELPEWLSGLI